MTLKTLRQILAGLIVGSLVLLAVHDLAHAKEKHPDQCEVCTLVAQATPHAPKAAPKIAAHVIWTEVSLELSAQSASPRYPKAASRDPPTV